jgi:hypothetical protein
MPERRKRSMKDKLTSSNYLDPLEVLQVERINQILQKYQYFQIPRDSDFIRQKEILFKT